MVEQLSAEFTLRWTRGRSARTALNLPDAERARRNLGVIAVLARNYFSVRPTNLAYWDRDTHTDNLVFAKMVQRLTH